jgi:hypothetical protein
MQALPAPMRLVGFDTEDMRTCEVLSLDVESCPLPAHRRGVAMRRESSSRDAPARLVGCRASPGLRGQPANGRLMDDYAGSGLDICLIEEGTSACATWHS